MSIRRNPKIISGLIGVVFCLAMLAGVGHAGLKNWPDAGFRGISLPLIAPVDGNNQDPGEFLSEATFQKIAQWQVNCVRLVVSFDAGSIWDVPGGTAIPPVPSTDHMAPYRRNLAALRVALSLAEKYGISVIILCEPLARYVPFSYEPGHATGGWQDGYIELWKNIAQEFGGRSCVIGYDLLNEPHGADEGSHWRTVLLPLVRNEIRTVDTDTYLIVEPWEWSFPGALAGFAPLDDPKVVYSFHHYAPHGYTHQKIYNYTGPDYDDKPYPGLLCTFTPPAVLWDKAALENSMKAVFEFQAANNAIIWVGEFSALRWAPGSAQWVKDSIEIFEKHHISWNYHMFGGWNGWNPTFDATDPSNNNLDGGKVTDRLQVLIDGWQKNSIPPARTPAPSPTPAAPPLVKASGKKLTTTKSKIVLEGTAIGSVTKVKYRVGTGGIYRSARGTAYWRIAVSLEPGRNVVTIIATGPGGSSAPVKVRIRRH